MRLDSDRQESDFTGIDYESVNFTSAEIYLHTDSAAGFQLWEINNSPVYVSNWGYYIQTVYRYYLCTTVDREIFVVKIFSSAR